MIKNISTSTFNTFINTLRQEQKQGFMLVKFQHKVGFFCGTLSNEKEITTLYKDTLAKTDENAKELVLKKVAEIVEAAHGNVLSFVAEGEMDDPKEKVVQQDAFVEAVEKEQNVVYELDDGPLTKEELNQIRKLSAASNIPEENFTRHLFKDTNLVEEQPKKQRRSRKAKAVEE
jgi:hypothetical protein